MSYTDLMYIHLATITPAFFIGALQHLLKKGTQLHKVAGLVFMALMLVTACVTLFMEAKVGVRLLNHFGFIHLFSLLTIYTVPKAYISIKKGDIESHKGAMIGLYIGGLIIAGVIAFGPGRYLNQVFFA